MSGRAWRSLTLVLAGVVAMLIASALPGRTVQGKHDRSGRTTWLGRAALVDEPCWFARESGLAAECAWLWPSRQDGGRDSALPVVVLRQHPQQRSSAAAVYLMGGPGGGSYLFDEGIQHWRKWRERLGLKLDLVVYDQRGSGSASPYLSCPGYAQALRDVLTSSAPPLTRWDPLDDALVACVQRVRVLDRRLGLYSSRTAAADLRELLLSLRQHHGYKDFVLYGVSYGTRLALEALRLTDLPVRRVVLDSSYPPGFDADLEYPSTMARVLADADAGTGLIASLDAAVARLRRQPVTARIEDPSQPGTHLAVHVDAAVLLMLVEYALYADQHSEQLPAMLAEVAAGRFDADWLAVLDLAVQSMFDPNVNVLAHTLIQCRDNPATTAAKVGKLFLRYPRYRDLLESTERSYTLCQRLDVPELPLSPPPLVKVPTLVLGMTLDPVTPPQLAQAMMPRLRDGRLLLVPGAGHAAVEFDDCAAKAAGTFLNRGWNTPPPACVADWSRARASADADHAGR